MNKLSTNEMATIVYNIRKQSSDYILSHNIKSLIIGVSGGLDSALVCALLKPICDDLNIPLIGRSITIESNSPQEMSRAENIGNHFCTDFKDINLTELYYVLSTINTNEKFDISNQLKYKIRMGNVKARMRMMYLYNLAGGFNGLVLSTDNLTEYYLGFWTLHGDVGDFGPIQQLWKSEVYQIAQFLCDTELAKDEDSKQALQDCINCNATDGLGITNTDLDQIMPDWKDRHTNTKDGYEEVDDILSNHIEHDIQYPNSKVIERYYASNFKRKNPYNLPRKSIFQN